MVVEMSHEVATGLEPYLRLFRELLDGHISASEFAERFVRPYLADATEWGPLVFPIVDRVFSDAEALIESDEDRPDALGASSPQELRESVRLALLQLAG